ncbi:MAG: DUF3996 domain-containing protein, partial [Spirochaetaceae bacterium]|nr:DUF3996 domain-containing protein [Spirochaetaceae bacterium]
MRPGFLFCTSLVFLLCAAANAEENPRKLPAESGLGTAVVVGEPTTVSAKLWISEASAIDVGAGWSFFRRTPQGARIRGAPYAYIDFLHHFFNVVKSRTGKFVYFIGAGVEGAYMDYNDKLRERVYLGLRIPFGLSYMFPDAPIDIFFEVVPSVVYMYGLTSDIGAGVG